MPEKPTQITRQVSICELDVDRKGSQALDVLAGDSKQMETNLVCAFQPASFSEDLAI
jgi:hypothetical protein